MLDARLQASLRTTIDGLTAWTLDLLGANELSLKLKQLRFSRTDAITVPRLRHRFGHFLTHFPEKALHRPIRAVCHALLLYYLVPMLITC